MSTKDESEVDDMYSVNEIIEESNLSLSLKRDYVYNGTLISLEIKERKVNQ